MKKKANKRFCKRFILKFLNVFICLLFTMNPNFCASAEKNNMKSLKIRNFGHRNSEESKFHMSKELSQVRDKYQLSLTAEGQQNQEPLFVSLVIDCTSSMGVKDVASDAEHDPNYGSHTTRWQVTSDSAKAFIDELYHSNPNREVNVCVVGFGYGGRIHTGQKDFPCYIPHGNERKNPPKTQNISDIPGALPGYIGGFRGSDSNIHVLNASDAFKQFEAVETVEDLFFKDRETVKHVIDGLSYYSGTNNESGFRLVNEIFSKLKNKNAKKSVVFVSDGETAASSTFAALWELPAHVGVNFSNFYEKTADTEFIDYLEEESRKTGVNPFDGNWHCIDPSANTGGRLKTAKEIVKKAKEMPKVDEKNWKIIQRTPDGNDPFDIESDSSVAKAEEFFEAVHNSLVLQRLYNPEAGYTDHQHYWNLALTGVFFQAQIRTTYKNSQGELIEGESIPKKHSKIPNKANKDERTNELDFVESSSSNISGSSASRNFALKIANEIKEEMPIFVVDIGKNIIDVQKTREYATNPNDKFYIDDSVKYFYHCYYNPDVYDDFHVSAGFLPSTMRDIAVKNSQDTRNVKISDTLSDSFSFESSQQGKPTIKLSYYQNSELLTEEIDTTDKIFIDDNTITARVGDLWDRETAKRLSEKSQDKFYFGAELSFGLEIDFDKLPKNTWINTNETAYFLYNNEQKSPEYKSPQIYIPDIPPVPPTPPEPPVPPQPPAPQPSPSPSPEPTPSPTPFPPQTSDNTSKVCISVLGALASLTCLAFCLYKSKKIIK
ncbi:MAG: VWA domain-containing protein [Oscillospiraceae bacterium]|jgi:hypothetical protein|nr:VWA domain-containing protein [Oscillospiraceae bacterium]